MSFFYVLLEVVLSSRLEATYRTRERSVLQVRLHVPLKVVFLMRLVVARGAAEIEDPTMAFLAQMSFRSTPEFPGIFNLLFCLLPLTSFLKNLAQAEQEKLSSPVWWVR